jgi:glycosyltransferase involved in cell wall biosynthesis
VKVDHVTFSKSGGAGLVAGNLVAHQQGLGVEARLNTLIESNLLSDPLSHPVITGAAIMDRYVVSNSPNGTLFSLYRNRIGALDKKILERDSILHLHWVNGVITSEDLLVVLESGRRVIYTLHDMSPFTGGCHHAHTCIGYESNCGNCPQVRPIFRARVEIQKKEALLPKTYSNLTLVTPTFWMESKVKASSRFRNSRVVTIPNPISEVYLKDIPKDKARYEMGISSHAIVFVLIADNLSDPIKNVMLAVESFGSLKNSIKTEALLVLVGSGGEKFENPEIGIRWTGKLDPARLATAAAAADWVLSSSMAESAGMTIAECASLGVPSIVIDAGGVSEMLIPFQSGFVARTNQDFRNFLESAIRKTLDQPKMSQAAKLFARKKFAPNTVAQRYLDLYGT